MSTTNIWPQNPSLQRKELNITFRGRNFSASLVAPSKDTGPRPLVIVVHNYQGLKAFDVDVAEYLARVGYVGMAIDMYGADVPDNEREFPTDPSKIQSFQNKCFKAMVRLDHDHEHFRGLLAAWIDAGLAEPWVQTGIAPAAIGYCFGGMAVIEGVRGGLNLSGVVSFHGLLQTGEDPNPAQYGAERPPLKPCPNDYNTKTVILIENGADDHLVPDESKQRFFAEMDAAGVDWSFHQHAKTPHGFALPPRLGPPGRLHEAADRRSTQNMLSFFKELFPDVEQWPVSNNASGTEIPV